MLSMTVQSLTHLLNVGATTTAKSRRQHVRNLPEGAHVVNLLFCALFLLRGFEGLSTGPGYGCTPLADPQTLTRFFTPC
jgi:hypothetical protein